MTPNEKTHQRQIAEQNVEAILDAAERLLRAHRQATISAVASEAGISRVTVYGHFRDREALIEAVVQRAVDRAMDEIRKVEPNRGPPAEALKRVIAASWNEIAHSLEIGGAASAELSPDAMRRAHETGRKRIRELTQRGRREGAFRTDVSTEWLVSSLFALVHAASDEVRAGHLSSSAALNALLATVPDLFGATPPARARGRSR